MRKPNGYGSIKKLSGKRRRPYVFVVTQAGRQKPIAYFCTQVEAEIYAADYNKIHTNRSLPGHKMTFAELYYRWLPAHIDNTSPAESTIYSYKNAFLHCQPLHTKIFADIKYVDYQHIIDNMRRQTSSSGCFVIFASDRDYGCDRLGIVPDSRNTFVCWNKGDTGQFTQSDFSWIALCI